MILQIMDPNSSEILTVFIVAVFFTYSQGKHLAVMLLNAPLNCSSSFVCVVVKQHCRLVIIYGTMGKCNADKGVVSL